uniref:hypothetical protein n=1 Tax=Psychrobacter sp. TaxID=56811 RepID=UPI0034504AB9
SICSFFALLFKKVCVCPDTSDKSGYLLHLSDTKFVYGSDLDKLTKTAPQQLEATFNPSNVKPHDLIVALADTYDGARPSDYRVYAIARVTCHNDIITLGKPILAPDNPGWNRPAEHCGASKEAGILDGFIGDKSQADYLAELQVQYPTCGALQGAFPDGESTQHNSKGTGFWNWLKRLFA